AGSLLFVYVCWQVFWLCQARVPPSLFLAFTGLPAPTTGGTRSLIQLCRGDWRGSLHYNPMAVPIILVLIATVGWLACQLVKRQRLYLPRASWLAWLFVLAVAWVVKLTQAALAAMAAD